MRFPKAIVLFLTAQCGSATRSCFAGASRFPFFARNAGAEESPADHCKAVNVSVHSLSGAPLYSPEKSLPPETTVKQIKEKMLAAEETINGAPSWAFVREVRLVAPDASVPHDDMPIQGLVTAPECNLLLSGVVQVQRSVLDGRWKIHYDNHWNPICTWSHFDEPRKRRSQERNEGPELRIKVDPEQPHTATMERRFPYGLPEVWTIPLAVRYEMGQADGSVSDGFSKRKLANGVRQITFTGNQDTLQLPRGGTVNGTMKLDAPGRVHLWKDTPGIEPGILNPDYYTGRQDFNRKRQRGELRRLE